MSWLSGFFGWLGSFFGFTTTNTAEVVKVQAEAVRLCGFLPTLETVVALMGVVAPVPGVGAGIVIAKKICTAVTRAKTVSSLLTAGEIKPEVEGIPIEGEWVNG